MAADLPPIPADAPKEYTRWRHWKGDTVVVGGMAFHSETKEPFVFYSHLGRMWIRPLSMWADEARPGVIRFTPEPVERRYGPQV